MGSSEGLMAMLSLEGTMVSLQKLLWGKPRQPILLMVNSEADNVEVLYISSE